MVLLTAVLAAACHSGVRQPAQQTTQSVAWRSLGSWSGHGNLQTQSFASDTGALRIRWETTSQSGDTAKPSAFFRLDAHSAISGRLLQQAVEQAGPGKGVGYVQQDPHVFYLVVESSDVNWAFTVEEAVAYP